MSDTPLASDRLGSLYRDHHGWLLGWLRRRLHGPEHAADLAHDTFLRVLRARRAEGIEEPRRYLSTIAGGLVVDFFRRRAVEQAYLDVLAGLPEPQQPSLETQAIVIESLLRIETMLAGLKPRVRQAFLMSQIEGLTYAEIALQLDVSLRTVKAYMALALDHCYDLAPW